jgi:hypothetical protein
MLRVVALKFCAAGAYVPWHLGTRCRMVDVVIVGGTWIGTGFVQSSELVTWICCSDANCHGRRIENGIIA